MGKLYVVGIGPGNHEDMTIRADRALRECDVIIGYHVYVDLVKDYYPDKQFMTTPMTKEADRCRMALEAAAEQEVCMVCSGDSGIYGMSALIYELRGDAAEPEIEVIPGITAACSGGALIGAPLTHDFTVISLSDRLTPWEKIEERLRAAAQADLSIVLYNPSSHGRADHLKKACAVLLETLPPDRICAIARSIRREGESYDLVTLSGLLEAETDMFCTIFIGNAMSRNIGGKMVTPRGYRYE